MRCHAILALLLIGCGRLGFDAGAPADAASLDAVPLSGDAAGDASPTSIADRLGCGGPVLLDHGGHLPHDTLVWVEDALGEWLVGVEHEDQDVHQIQRHALGAVPGGVAAGDAELMLQVDHVDQMRFEPVPGGGYVLGYTEFVLGTAAVVPVTPAMIQGTPQQLGPLAAGNPALARAGGGPLVMIGIHDGVEVVAIGDGGAPTGAMNVVAPASEEPDMPTLTTMDSGVAAMWHSGRTGQCRMATLDNDLRITHGPVDMATSGGACTDAHAAWLPASRHLVLVASDAKDDTIARSVWDENLAPIVAPSPIASSAHWVRIIDDGDGAWIAWVDDSTGQQIRYGRLAADGSLARMSVAFGQLDTSLGHYHTLQRVGQSVIALWTDTTMGRTFSAMRVCF